ncbi:rhodanese-related sulfurtransferase [Brachybacterium sp. p3-SID957]|uniref:oxygen-dependent tRNA uridine(34) hydroxylase TrhO n=1 Tax=Brachybacterium sp. p3-SID957 TaxID=2916049 RepID=UPI00223B7C2D|nr:rhodanese-related sulfurtransferase [Brachybacterium sp. p3-SID957]MCT1776613.1 rhodanese-related sulfurtransferase [Brachybacterium sp. p3-SID957]
MSPQTQHRIILFYVFTPLADPEAVRLWQFTLAQSLGLRGRVILSEHGINATLGGELGAIKTYVRALKGYAPFRGADVKWSQGTGEDFPRLLVKVRPELVTFGRPEEIKVGQDGVVGGGEHLTPQQLHELVAARGEDVVFFDGRNTMEAAIGRFRGAVVPDVTTTRDFLPELESGRYDELKDKTVVTYCTGGIRCEVLTVLMKNRGFQHVYQLGGGIVRYGEAFRDKGLWDGSLYTFDGTMHREFADGVQSLGRCIRCGEPTPRYVNCEVPTCRKMVLACEDCEQEAEPLHAVHAD